MFATILIACASDGGNVPSPTSAEFDVSGASNVPCTLTVDTYRGTVTFDIAAPSPAVPNAQAETPAALVSMCELGDAGVPVNVTTTSTMGCVQASRTSTRLCFTQSGCLGLASQSSGNCPTTVTLTCDGVKLYDSAPWFLCSWMG